MPGPAVLRSGDVLALGQRPLGEALLAVQSGLPAGGDGAGGDGAGGDGLTRTSGARALAGLRVSCSMAALLTPYAIDEPPAL